MKTMTCRQLGGAFDIKFQAETFGEMSELSMQHPATMNQWFLERKAEFDALPED